MIKNYLILFIITFSGCFESNAQSKLEPFFIEDSLIKKHHIRKITEKGFGNINDTIPYWVTTEYFDSLGRIRLRGQINSNNWNVEEIFEYKAHTVTMTLASYDLNNFKKTIRGDSFLYKDKKRYALKSQQKKIKEDTCSYNKIGQLTRLSHRGKSEIFITQYSYNQSGQVTSIKKLSKPYSKHPAYIISIDSFDYFMDGKLNRKIAYNSFEIIDGIEKSLHETTINYFYNEMGLLNETRILQSFILTEGTKKDTTKYTYSYEFFNR